MRRSVTNERRENASGTDSELTVVNYKGLRNVTIPISHFVCVTGHNNAGKSSLLQALLAFLDGKKLGQACYYDPNLDIEICVQLENICAQDLDRIINPEHRTRIGKAVTDGRLKLVRRFSPDGVSRMRWVALVPADERFSGESIEQLSKGKRPSVAFAAEIREKFPELGDKVDAKTTGALLRTLVETLGDEQTFDAKIERETDLPTGIDAGIRPLLPDPIFIPAVKDFGDDIKPKESSSFGKLMGILLAEISPEFGDMQNQFQTLDVKLNRGVDGRGNPTDDRLEAVRRIEATIESYSREHFPEVRIELRIPPPDLRSVLAAGNIEIDDGVKGDLESKGDGLKRTVVFAILRTIAETRRRIGVANMPRDGGGFILLFEEPELYLHPTAQRILFAALKAIALIDHVIITTHSPLFFDGDATKTFVKIRKRQSESPDQKPYAEAFRADLGSIDAKAGFQIISFETSNLAFFYRTVVLVEGDTDYLVFPHIARTLDIEWCVDRNEIAVCRLHGKGNIRRYRAFFRPFGVRVVVFADLDCILEGFDQLDATSACIAKRSQLLQALDARWRPHLLSGDQPGNSNPSTDSSRFEDKLRSGMLASLSISTVRDMFNAPEKATQWDNLYQAYERCLQGNISLADFKTAGDAFFARQQAKSRRAILESDSTDEIDRLKHETLILLRQQDIFLLSRCAIEKYIPADIIGSDKPSRAMKFCNAVTTRDGVLSLCDRIPIDEFGTYDHELRHVFSQIFRPHAY